VGSPTFVPFLERHRDLLAADVILVADSANWAVGVPALTTSLRIAGVGENEAKACLANNAIADAVIADYRGIPVKKLEALRIGLRKTKASNSEFRVAKNSVLKRSTP